MYSLFLDTNGYSDMRRGKHNIVSLLRQTNKIFLNSIVLGELISGFKMGNKFDNNHKELKEFINNENVIFIPIVEKTSQFYSDIYTKLKTNGTPIPTNDIWIAASVMEYNLKLFSNDKHFTYIDGITLIQ